MRSFTAEELEQATGFDRRTIAYYVQEDLLPRVGRRGPRSRYPQLVMDRLLFIRRVREAEEAGEISAISLSDLRSLFERVSPDVIAAAAQGHRPIDAAIGETHFRYDRSPVFERARRREVAWSAMEASEAPRTYADMSVGSVRSSGMDDAEIEHEALADALAALQALARRGSDRDPGAVDVWSRVEISPEITLSVRGISEEDAPLLEEVARKLRGLIYGD